VSTEQMQPGTGRQIRVAGNAVLRAAATVILGGPDPEAWPMVLLAVLTYST